MIQATTALHGINEGGADATTLATSTAATDHPGIRSTRVIFGRAAQEEPNLDSPLTDKSPPDAHRVTLNPAD